MSNSPLRNRSYNSVWFIRNPILDKCDVTEICPDIAATQGLDKWKNIDVIARRVMRTSRRLLIISTMLAFILVPAMTMSAFATSSGNASYSVNGCNGQHQSWSATVTIPTPTTTQVKIQWNWANPISVGIPGVYCFGNNVQAWYAVVHDTTTGYTFCIPNNSQCGQCVCGVSGASGTQTFNLVTGTGGTGYIYYGDTVYVSFTVYYAYYQPSFSTNSWRATWYSRTYRFLAAWAPFHAQAFTFFGHLLSERVVISLEEIFLFCYFILFAALLTSNFICGECYKFARITTGSCKKNTGVSWEHR